jgi:hypothetical protein
MVPTNVPGTADNCAVNGDNVALKGKVTVAPSVLVYWMAKLT